MAVQTQNAPARSRSKRRAGVEYWIYFALLLGVLLPTAIVKHTISFVTGSVPEEGVLQDAMSNAHTAASMIFSA